VDVAAIRECHFAAAVSQRCSGASEAQKERSALQRALKPAMHILNKVFDSDIALLASFVSAVDNSSSYDTTGLSVTGRWVCDDRFYGLVNRSNR